MTRSRKCFYPLQEDLPPFLFYLILTEDCQKKKRWPSRTRRPGARFFFAVTSGVALVGAIVYSNFVDDGGVVPKGGVRSEDELRQTIAVAANNKGSQ
jgi:hypothetical protein